MKRAVGGFTIVELLIAIVIIAILASISVVAYNGISKRAQRSAQLYENSQIERQIAVNALQADGESISINNGSLIGFKEDAGTIDLVDPITSAQDITMYGVLEVIGASSYYSTYTHLTPLIWGSNVFSLDTDNSVNTNMRARIDTPSQLNLVAASPQGYYVSGQTVICWVSANHATARIELGCNQGAAQGQRSFTTSHAGWNFTGLQLDDRSDNVIAGMVFDYAQDEVTRTQVVKWLADKYGIAL